MTTAHHGHFLWEIGVQDDTVTVTTPGETNKDFQVGYGTSQGEQALFILNLDEHKQEDLYDFSKDVIQGTCPGAATMAYCRSNQHVYVQCAGAGGTLEFDVSRPKSPLFVTQHAHIGGALLETPDKKYVTATDKTNNVMHFFEPLGNGQASTDPFRVSVAGHPEAPVFYQNADTYDYVACMPLTQNTNRRHIVESSVFHIQEGTTNATTPASREDDPVKCDYFNGCSQATSQGDVNRGMCLYRNGVGQGPLLTAVKDDLPQIQASEAPFGQACQRCRHEDSFKNNKQLCVCTPECGACAPEEYPRHEMDPLLWTSALPTGVMCVDVKDALLGVAKHAELVLGAGAIRQQRSKIDDPACGFAEPHRAHKLGSKVYDASISNVPYPELIIVDVRVMTLKCKVRVVGEPQQVIYVPTAFHYKTASEGLGAGLVAGIVLICLAFVGGTAYLAVRGSRFATQRDLEVSIEKATSSGDANIEMTNGGPQNGHVVEDETSEEEGTFAAVSSPEAPPAVVAGQLA